MPTRSNYIDTGDPAPDFVAQSTAGEIRFHDYVEGAWALFTTHPHAFTPVCSTELIAEARRYPELAARGVKALTIAEGSIDDQHRWTSELAKYSGVPIDFPVVADDQLEVGDLYGVLRAGAKGEFGLSRTAFLIDPQKVVRWRVTYPQGTGRNIAEIIRVLDSLQIHDRDHVFTPADWQQGGDVLVLGDLELFDANEGYEKVESGVPYLNYRKPVEAR